MRRVLRPQYVLPVLGALLVLAWITFHYAAEITVKGEFYDLLGMGQVYDLRWRWGLVLAGIGLLISLVLAVPVMLVSRTPGQAEPRAQRPRRPTGPLTEEEIERLTRRLDAADLASLSLGDDPQPPVAPADPAHQRAMRWGARGGALVSFLLIAGVLIPGLVGSRDRILAALDAQPFGQTDPVFGRDVSFFIFTEPALRDVIQVLSSALFLSGLGIIATGLSIWYSERQRGALLESRAILDRTLRYAFVVGGLFLLCMAALLWLSRYAMTVGGSEVVAGAGAAARDIDIPTRAVGAVMLGILALGLMALSVTRLRQRLGITRIGTGAMIGAGIWAATSVALVVVASPWWLVMAVPLVALTVALSRGRNQPWGRADTPVWAVPAFCAASAIVVSAIGPVGALLNDAIVLRGTQLQVEQENIQATLTATRRASGIDAAVVQTADYRPGGVTQRAVREAPASVDSLRFLDLGPTLQACRALQAKSRFYDCDDVDVDRYVLGGKRRTVFAIGREIDYTRAPDFQRRHFTYTHGYGIILAPVNQIDPISGRPAWVAGNIPQTGIDPPLTHPEIYFGAQRDMPWAIAGTRQPVFDGLANRPDVTWCTGQDAARCGGEGGTGLRIGGGWRRLAITQFLGGLPYVGGGRRVWNATSGSGRAPAGPESRLLLYRDIGARLAELAPFLTPDSDPWFVAAQGRLWVVQNLYVSSSRYPYAASFNGVNYQRQPVVAAMDAYSGETRLFVTDESEPMIRTWRKVYPELFTSGTPENMDRLAPGLRDHLRYGEDLFDFQGQAAQRFHVEDVDSFYNSADTWAPTQERYGPGVDGQLIVSPARYTYAVLPGEKRERFVLVRSYKPQATNRSIGFSGWLAVSSEPDDFGKLTIINFSASGNQLESLDTFTANVGRNDTLSQEIGQRPQAVQRGNTIVVPIGQGLLYVQPLYLDSGNDLPSLWRVVVGLGDGRVVAAPTFGEALALALGSDEPGAGSGAQTGTLSELVERAAAEFEAYRKAFGEGRYEEAARRLSAFQRALEQARRLARQQGQGDGATRGG